MHGMRATELYTPHRNKALRQKSKETPTGNGGGKEEPLGAILHVHILLLLLFLLIATALLQQTSSNFEPEKKKPKRPA